MSEYAWATDELIPSRFEIVEVADTAMRIEPCHVGMLDVVAFPKFGWSFSHNVSFDHPDDGWINAPSRYVWEQTAESWSLSNAEAETDPRPFEWEYRYEYSVERGRTLPFPIVHVRNVNAGDEGVIVGRMFAATS